MCASPVAFGMATTFSLLVSHARLTCTGVASCFSATSRISSTSSTFPRAMGQYATSRWSSSTARAWSSSCWSSGCISTWWANSGASRCSIASSSWSGRKFESPTWSMVPSSRSSSSAGSVSSGSYVFSGQWTYIRSIVSTPSFSALSRVEESVSSYERLSVWTFEARKTSERSTSAFAMPAPTAASFSYPCAVSTLR